MKTEWLERPAVVIPLLALAVCVLLSGCWNAPFCVVDDGLTLYQALTAKSSDVYSPRSGKHFMPLTDLSLRLNFLFKPAATMERLNDAMQGKGGEFDLNSIGPTSFRLMNGLYHFIASILLWIFLCRLCAGAGVGAGIAFFAALAWTMHPMTCESVCWIAERKSSLSAMFGFAALAIWTIDPARRWRWPLLCFVYLLALLSKQAALGLLPAFLALEVLDPMRHQFNFRDRMHWLKLVLRFVPLFALAILFSLIGMRVYALEIVDPMEGGLPTILFTDAWLMAVYIRHMLIPVGLSFAYYVQPVVSLADPRLWIGLATTVSVFGGLIWLTERSKRTLTIFGLLWFVGGLGPLLNFVPVPAPLQDRWTYFGLAGFLMALALAVSGLLQRRESLRTLLPQVCGGALAALVVLCVMQSSVYATNEKLLADSAVRETDSGYAQLLAAELYRNKHLQAVRENNPKEAEFCGKLAAAFYLRAIEAPDIELFKDALIVRNSTAELLIGLRQYDRARSVLEGWLPPKGRTLFTAADSSFQGVGTKIVRSRRALRHTYTAQALSHGWDLMAECSMQQANKPGLALPAQMELAQRALREIDQAIAADKNGERGEIIKARILMLMSFIEADSGRDEPAQKLFSDAQAVLKAVPESSPSAPMAKGLLAKTKPPKTKQP